MMANRPRPSLLIVSYGMVAGGGETFPIFLANGLRARGWAVSFLDLGVVEPEIGVRDMLAKNIPFYRLTEAGNLRELCGELGINIIHTCHVSSDLCAARMCRSLPKEERPKHVITMHGCYETLDLANLLSVSPEVTDVDHFVYTAQKNLHNFSDRFIHSHQFTFIPNALPAVHVLPKSRTELGISSGATVAMLISRAVPEKGWDVACKAVSEARTESGKDLHLIIIGDGPVYEDMAKQEQPDWLHLLGFQTDIRSWIAIADLGLLPTTFSGESYPLVLIDFLASGVPVIATTAGEIREMMATESGHAGYLVELENRRAIEAGFRRALNDFLELAPEGRQALQAKAKSASQKFDFDLMLASYERIYESLEGAVIPV